MFKEYIYLVSNSYLSRRTIHDIVLYDISNFSPVDAKVPFSWATVRIPTQLQNGDEFVCDTDTFLHPNRAIPKINY